MFEGLRRAILLLLLASIISYAQPSVAQAARSELVIDECSAIPWSQSIAKSSLARSTVNTATCMSRTVNYITHSLPQQCLRTDRMSANSTSPPSTGGNATISKGLDEKSPGTVVAVLTSSSEAIKSSDPHVSGGRADATRTSDFPTINATVEATLVPATTVAVKTIVVEHETETDSPLDNAHFLSFEEWKNQNLAKAGQSPENVGQDRLHSGGRQRPGINNALDTLGEENEIELDFSGFGGNVPAQFSETSNERPDSTGRSEHDAAGQSSPGNNLLRSKDAGKTCKERTNYASFDCAATILKSNKEGKSASSVLVENKDSYMLNTCSAQNKFFIIELCNDILIDTVVLANYEFFSSIFRHFRVSVSDRYPVKTDGWKDLGTFEARNTREVQAFLIENPLIWARYLRIEFLTHYGNEYYCPVSLLRVHGKTMMQEFRQQEELARGELDEEPALGAEGTLAPQAAQEPLVSTDESHIKTLQDIRSVKTEAELLSTAPAAAAEAPSTHELIGANANTVSVSKSANVSTYMSSELRQNDSVGATCAATLPGSSIPPIMTPEGDTMRSTESPPNTTAASSATAHTILPTTVITDSRSKQALNTNTSEGSASTSDAPAATAYNSSTRAPDHANTSSSTPSSNITSTTAPTHNVTSSTNSVANASSNSTRSLAHATPAASPQPATQESFFKSISKRLQQLESNSTLSLQYIEEQSRILRDAFNKVEKRQISATSNFLTHLNETVMSELNGFRQAYDQLWQSTVIELDGQREQYQREMLALSTRLTLVADELVWQKRMGIVQSTLLLLCLSLALFARQGDGNLEMPLLQHMMNKSQAALRAGWDSEPNSPSPASRSPVSLFRRKLWRSSVGTENGHLTDGTDSRPRTGEELEVQLEPPTPTTNGAQSDGDDLDDEDALGMQSSPATPNGTAEGLKRPPDWSDDAYRRPRSSLSS